MTDNMRLNSDLITQNASNANIPTCTGGRERDEVAAGYTAEPAPSADYRNGINLLGNTSSGRTAPGDGKLLILMDSGHGCQQLMDANSLRRNERNAKPLRYRC
jgi:hypothetical protein